MKNKQEILGKKEKENLEMDTAFQNFGNGNAPLNRITVLASLQPMSSAGFLKEKASQLDVNKIVSITNVPTYTVRNIFSPSSFFKETSMKKVQLTPSRADMYWNYFPLYKNYFSNEMYSPRRYHNLLMDEYNVSNIGKKTEGLPVHKFFSGQSSSTTYYGFADFTTIVGERVIIFNPSTSTQELSFAYATLVPEKATLDCIVEGYSINAHPSMGMHDIAKLIVPETSSETGALISAVFKKPSGNVDIKDGYKDALINDARNTKITATRTANSTITDKICVRSQFKFSRPSNQEVSEIYDSFSRAEAKCKSQVPVHLNMYSIITSHETYIAKSVEKNIIIANSLQSIEVNSEFNKNRIQPSSIAQTLSRVNTISFLDGPLPNLVTGTVILHSNDLKLVPIVNKNVIVKMNIHNNRSHIELDEIIINLANVTEHEKLRYCLRSSNFSQVLQAATLYCSNANLISTLPSASEITYNNTTLLQTSNLEKQMEHIFIREKDIADIHDELIVLKKFSSEDKNTVIDFNTQSNGVLYSAEGDSDEDIELLYKTLFTTYTYLTTFFNDENRTSIATHTELFTNIITSTLYSNSEGISLPTTIIELSTLENVYLEKDLKNIITEEKVFQKKSENKEKFILPTGLGGMFRVRENNNALSTENNIDGKSNVIISLYDRKSIQTYLTTYTYYTTVFVNDVIKIMSRTEVYSNYDAVVLTPRVVINDNEPTNKIHIKISPRIRGRVEKNNEFKQDSPTLLSNGMLNKSDKSFLNITNTKNKRLPWFIPTTATYTKTVFDTSYPKFTNKEAITPNIERAITNLKLHIDQISSKSNTDEIKSLSTLLLHTSFTTFTYYTTMYSKDMTNIARRLETITNIVSETLQANKIKSMKEAPLLITFFTTFTYWTKLSKNGEVATLSREETISTTGIPFSTIDCLASACDDHVKKSIGNANITASESDKITKMSTFSSLSVPVIDFYGDAIIPITTNGLELITFYTTFTYYTTSYDFDKTIIHSHYEIMTNIITTTLTSAIGSEPVICNETNFENFNSKILSPNNSLSSHLSKMGLQRLIGSGFQTSYHPEVLATYIENSYPQITATTSTLAFETNQIKLYTFTILDGASTKSVASDYYMTNITIRESANPMTDSSLTEYSAINFANKCDSFEDKHDRSGDEYYKIPFPTQSVEPPFSPVIRPFPLRNRSHFDPRRKTIALDSPSFITRNDFTPTITATPSLKTVLHLSSPRKGGLSSNSLSREEEGVTPLSRRSFRRLIKPSHSVGDAVLSNLQSILFSSIGGAGRISPPTRPSHQSSHGVGVLIRPSSASSFRSGLLNIHTGNTGTRFKGTSLFSLNQQNSTTLRIGSLEQIISGEVEPPFEVQQGENEKDINAISLRSQNHILHFRSPIPNSGSFTAFNSKSLLTHYATIVQRPASKNFVRPQSGSLLTRTRHLSNPFPPRILQPKQKLKENTSKNGNQYDESMLDKEDDSEYEAEYSYHNKDYAKNTKRRRRSNSPDNQLIYSSLKSSKKFNIPLRYRREADRSFQTRSNLRNRVHHSKPLAAKKEVSCTENLAKDMLSKATPTSRQRTSGRFSDRYSGHRHTQAGATTTTDLTTNHFRVVPPTRPTNRRAQFTLRNKNSTATQKSFVHHNTKSYRRPQNAASSQRLSAPLSNNRRVKSYNSNSLSLESPSRVPPRSRNNLSRMRTILRGRNRNEYKAEQAALPYDGSITVTHFIPQEITIPVIDGKVTEYKSIVTAKISTELLGSHQYTSFLGSNGQTVLALTREDSSVNSGGATEITHYLLHESPTTTVIFTPTTIRGRKTSFSHVIPSTAYSVENLVSTSMPHVSGNAPLANILLSQLLFGNIVLHGANPLLGALGVGSTPINAEVPLTPVTEYRTHKSTYVTTIYEGLSTVIPVTFQGKRILTTVYETSAQTITATEIVTDTIVSTQAQQVIDKSPEINSMFLQQILLQKALQSKFEQPILHPDPQPPEFTHKLQELFTNNIRITNENDTDIHTTEENRASKVSRKKARKTAKSSKQKLPTSQEDPEEGFSVITLYVSSKRPGEFSTILSTLTLSHTATIHKRQVNGNVKQINCIGDINNLYITDGSEYITKNRISYLVDSNMVNYLSISKIDLNMNKKGEHTLIVPTQTAKTIIGDVDA
ncbi:uncharacterized protein [Eurosta solidaginis]|uniref:uncharacterized protein n=1 Tax=Eurosta solidaginis TaxID=178769 RepID=UPI0035313E47